MLPSRKQVHGNLTCALLCTLILAPGLVASRRKPWPDAASFPDPSKDVDSCGRAGVASRICDPDHVLSKEGADVTEGVLNLIAAGEPPYAKAPCGTSGLQGYEVGVAILHRLALPSGSEDDAAAVQQFAHELHSKWGVGGATCQTGVLLVLAIRNRQLYISTGAGAKQQLDWDTLGNIIDQAKPLLKEKRYDDAVQQTVVNIGLAIAGKKIEPVKPQTDWWGLIFVGGFIGLVCGAACMGERRHGRARARYRDCKALLERIKRDQAALQTDRYEVTSCPICLEEFALEPEGDAAAATSGRGGAHNGAAETEPLLGPAAATASSAASASGAAATAAAAAGSAAAAAAGPRQGKAQQGGDAAGQPSRRAMVVKCGHVFCEACLTQWVEQQRKFSCPICRRDMDTGEEQPLQGGPSSSSPYESRPPCDDTQQQGGQTTVEEQQAAWDQAFPEAVLPGNTLASHATTNMPRLRLYGARRGAWRYRGTSGYRLDDLRHGGITQEEARQLFLTDLMFRLTALRRRYPEYVTDSMARTWLQDVRQGRQLSAAQLMELQLQDPDVRREMARQGARGSGSSGWGGGGGGGSSSGGRGGSW